LLVQPSSDTLKIAITTNVMSFLLVHLALSILVLT